MSERIKILFLGANPVDISYRVRLDEEVREIEDRLHTSAPRDSFELISRWAVKPSDLQALLLRHEPHILHFSGYGTTKGIALENEDGKIAVINKKALAELLKIHREKIRVVLLNPSYSKPQAEAFRQSVDFMIGIKKGMKDNDAILFAATFYCALAFGHSIKEAFELAEMTLEIEAIAGWERPELLIREGANASSPFLSPGLPDATSGQSKRKEAIRASIPLLSRSNNASGQNESRSQSAAGKSRRGTSVVINKARIIDSPTTIGEKEGKESKDDPKTIQAESKSAIERLASGDFSDADRQKVAALYFNGQLQYVPGVTAGRDISDSIVIIGNHANVRVELGEAVFELIRERLFPKPRGIAPPFPVSVFVGREEALHDVKRLLGSTKSSSQSNIVIVRGWPGVGKTTLVGVIGRDPEVIAAFPDGVLWAPLTLKADGQPPDLLSEMAAWGRAMGTDELLRAPMLEEASKRLGYMLQDKRMLLILDDVWESEHAIPFLKAAGTNCATLITTHTTATTVELAPPQKIYVLPVLTEEHALNLLRIISPLAVKRHPDECRKLVRALEYLPLALHVAGRMINTEMQTGFGLRKALKYIQDGTAIIKARAPADRIEGGVQPTVQAILKKSTDLLDEYTRECFAFLGPFAPKPATFDLKALKFQWQVEDPLPIVDKLVAHGLLEPAGAGKFQMHALLVLHARSLLE